MSTRNLPINLLASWVFVQKETNSLNHSTNLDIRIFNVIFRAKCKILNYKKLKI